jgi:hypothetical protein
MDVTGDRNNLFAWKLEYETNITQFKKQSLRSKSLQYKSIRTTAYTQTKLICHVSSYLVLLQDF